MQPQNSALGELPFLFVHVLNGLSEVPLGLDNLCASPGTEVSPAESNHFPSLFFCQGDGADGCYTSAVSLGEACIDGVRRCVVKRDSVFLIHPQGNLSLCL